MSRNAQSDGGQVYNLARRAGVWMTGSKKLQERFPSLRDLARYLARNGWDELIREIPGLGRARAQSMYNVLALSFVVPIPGAPFRGDPESLSEPPDFETVQVDLGSVPEVLAALYREAEEAERQFDAANEAAALYERLFGLLHSFDIDYAALSHEAERRGVTLPLLSISIKEDNCEE